MVFRRVAGIAVSFGLHALAMGAAVAIVRELATPPLLFDLVDGVQLAPDRAGGDDASPGAAGSREAAAPPGRPAAGAGARRAPEVPLGRPPAPARPQRSGPPEAAAPALAAAPVGSDPVARAEVTPPPPVTAPAAPLEPGPGLAVVVPLAPSLPPPSPAPAPSAPRMGSEAPEPAVRETPRDASALADPGAPVGEPGHAAGPSGGVGAGAAPGSRPGGGVGAAGGEGRGPKVALAPGRGGGAVTPEYGPYLGAFRRRVQEALAYPVAARRQRLEGTVELEVLIEPAGRVAQVRVLSSSAHADLDEAAIDAVRRIAPLPLPEHLPRRALRVRLPLVFQLR